MSSIEAMKMRKSARLSDEQAEPEDEFPEEPKAKKNRSDKRITNIATLDNGTMVEAFKYLNYRQLAKSSLVSRRFWNLIRTNRHRLALLCVDNISMRSNRGYALSSPTFVKVFNNVLSLEDYNKWVVGNQYSKQILLEDPYHRQPYSRASSDLESSISDSESSTSDSESNSSESWSNNSSLKCTSDSESSSIDSDNSTCVLVANAELNHENWPLFQHFVRLLTDPFIYIRSMELFPQNDVLDLLTGAIEPDRSRLQCEHLTFYLNSNGPKFMSWIKGHMRCDEIQLDVQFKISNHFKPLLDFFATGSHCTSAIETTSSTANLSNVVTNFVQKFIDLKSSDECQMVESIRGCVSKRKVDAFKRNYTKFIVKDETDRVSCHRVFEFVNNDAKKKLELIFSHYMHTASSYYSLKIENL